MDEQTTWAEALQAVDDLNRTLDLVQELLKDGGKYSGLGDLFGSIFGKK